MTQRRTVSSGSQYESVVGYSRAVRVGPHVVVAGTTADGGDIAAQTREALRRIEGALHEAGAALSDGGRTRLYVADISQGQGGAAGGGEGCGEMRRGAPLVRVAA